MNLLRSDLNRNYPYNVVVRNKVVLAACAFLLFLAYLIYSSLTQAQASCEVCINFRGRTGCGSARGVDANEAQRTATDVACAPISSGVTDSIACGNTPPIKLMCSK
jgi:hypothetical protein